MYLTYHLTPGNSGYSQQEIAHADALQARVVYLPFAHTHNRSEADVERINSFSFYGAGKDFKALETTRDNAQPGDLFWPLHQAMAAAERLLEGKPIPLGISHAKVVVLRDQMTAVWN